MYPPSNIPHGEFKSYHLIRLCVMQSTFRFIVGHPEHKSGEVHSCVWQLVAESRPRSEEKPPPQISGEIEMSPHTAPGRYAGPSTANTIIKYKS